MKSEEIAALIPRPVTMTPTGKRIPYWQWTYPRSRVYEAIMAPLLPAGWILYSALDAIEGSARDYGARREDDRAFVFGVRKIDGEPKHLRASVPRPIGLGACDTSIEGRDKFFDPHALAEACRWCDERIAEQEEQAI